jgi:hypothetical protein
VARTPLFLVGYSAGNCFDKSLHFRKRISQVYRSSTGLLRADKSLSGQGPSMFNQVVLDPRQGCRMFVIHIALHCFQVSSSFPINAKTLAMALSRSAIATSRMKQRAAHPSTRCAHSCLIGHAKIDGRSFERAFRWM